MGEFFPDEKERMPKEVKKKEPELIKDPNELLINFESVVRKIQEMTDQTYSTIIPIRTTLRGDPRDMRDIGQINTLRQAIKGTRLERMTIGQEIHDILKNIEDLDAWSDRYAQFIEKNADDLAFICKSAFKIIDNLYGQIDALNLKIKQFESQMMVPIQPPQIGEKPLTPKTVKEFTQAFKERVDVYMEIYREGNIHRAKLAKGRAFALCGKSIQKRELAEQIFKEMTEKVDGQYIKEKEPKESESQSEIFSPITQVAENEAPLYDEKKSEKKDNEYKP